MTAARRKNHRGASEKTVFPAVQPLLPHARRDAVKLLEQLQAAQPAQPQIALPLWREHLEAVQALIDFLGRGGTAPFQQSRCPPMSPQQRRDFGKLLRDRRNAARLSRVQLAQLAKVSDATVKFAETARHPPSRSTLIRLLNVSALQLSWDDVPGQWPPHSISRTANAAVLTLDRLEFDELGDPVFVRSLAAAKPDLSPPHVPRPCEFIPLRRGCP